MKSSQPSESSGMEWKTALVLSVLSGAAALGHQLLWTRRMIDLLGAGAESTSRVFGVFFLGLALGSAAALVLAARARRPWRWLAVAEIAIAALAVPLYLLPWWSGGIWPALGPERLISGWGGMIKLGLSVALVLPPAFVMGWFLPFAAKGLFGGDRTLAKHGVSLYGWNTMGGVAGLALAVVLFLPLLGAGGAAAAVIFLNLLTAVGCLWLDRRASPMAAEMPMVAPAAIRSSTGSSVARNPWLWGLAFFSGFGILALEVTALQMLMLVAPLSFHAPAGILICVILVLALAAFATRRLTNHFTPSALLAPALALTGVLAAITPLLFYTVAMVTGGLPPAPNLTLFLLRLTLFVLFTCGALFLAAGVLFPALTAWIGGEDGGGRRWGGLLAVNGVGGLAGAETAHGLLLPWAGPFGTAWIIGGLYAGLGLTLALYPAKISTRAPNSGRLAGAALGAAALWLLLGTPVRTLSPVNPHMNVTVLQTMSGREGVLSVVERGDFGRGLLVYNQYMLGTTSARHDQERQAHLPLLLHPNPEEVAFIGLATGITPGAALLHRGAGNITAVELSSQVAAASRDWFTPDNHGLFEDPRARVVIEDGRTYLAASRNRFDVVAGDLFLPWGPGEARLYSREHFAAVRKSLRSGGVFCQWLALYQLRPVDLEVILRTFQEVFPETWLFVNTFRPDSPALALVGFREGQLDWDTVETRIAAERENGLIRDPVVRHRSGIEMLHLGRARDPGPGPVHTLTNLWIELAASRERITGNPSAKYLSGQSWIDWSGPHRKRSPETGGPPTPELAETGHLLARREILLREGEELTAAERQRLREIFPTEINRDDEAKWSSWPGVTPRF